MITALVAARVAPRFSCSGVAALVAALHGYERSAVACEPPEKSGRPVTEWTHAELADEVVRRGIVESISPRHLGRLLAEADLHPHRVRYWLNAKDKDDGAFAAQVQLVCATYAEAPPCTRRSAATRCAPTR